MKTIESASGPHPVRLLGQLVSGTFSRRDYLDEGKNRIKLALRTLLTLPASYRWLGFLASQPVMLDYLRLAPRLAQKLHRPYLHRGLGNAAKADMLQQHYSQLLQLPASLRGKLLSLENLKLASVSGKDDSQFGWVLGHNHTFDKEGELSLQFIDGQQVALATLTFTLCQYQGQSVALVGGLQGPRKEFGHECIRTATKACHGLFPKRLALEALTIIARKMGCQQVLAVCKDSHIYSSWRYRRDFQADYDSFWLDIGAEKINTEYFRIPFPIPRKPMEDIASKKRSEYNRRYALLDEMASQIVQSLH
ncbi:VirK/YbjX family protein [Aquitalea aquatilis]|uniref:VirK/YbjX family protein n=1 Tax=Aquitalea aquatilis TaxID=1537400 RepID=UPI00143D24B5|nr:VirK/YbjX family protein [Aquitalea aquatilis]